MPVQPALCRAVLGVGAMLTTSHLLFYDLVWSLLPLAWFAAHASEHGSRRGDRIWLLLVWLTPQFNQQFRELLGYQLAPFVLFGFFFWLLWRASAFDLQQTQRLDESVNQLVRQ